jgi:NADH-quinone oxidoreductase subunit E
MSMFSNPWKSVSDEWQGMTQDLAEPFRKDVAGAMGLLANPAAGFAAMSALVFGLAGHAFGFWLGAMTGAAQASQRLFAPLAFGDGGSAAAEPVVRPAAVPVAFPKKPKPALKVVPRAEPPAAAEAVAEPAAAAATASPEQPAGSAPVAAAAPPESAAKVAEAEVGPVVAPPEPAAQPAPLQPEDFHKPASIERPAAPDDLKAISGIGPKLEKVLNDLGVWTYAQVAAWGKPEIAWIDDYLAFRGRIERDGWIEQARALSGTRKRGGK